MHDVAFAHDIPDSAASLVASVGMSRRFHVLPFQDSARVEELLLDGSYVPTGRQSEELMHQTDDRVALSAPAGFTGLCALQVEPFHVSASVTAMPGRPRSPTARQNEVVGQDTALKVGAPMLVGVFSTVQTVPFHRSTPVAPTAWQSAGRGHATAARSLSLFRNGVPSVVQPR